MTFSVTAVADIPEVEPGDNLAELIADRAELAGGEIVVVAQKIVSKAEGRFAEPHATQPSPRALELAASTGKDPRFVQLVLDESTEVLRVREGLLIVETRHGFVCANAGIDSSNVPGDTRVLLLPVDPDASARRLRAQLRDLTGGDHAVIITDSFGRAWRVGQLDVAIGCSGIEPLRDERGARDRQGRELVASIAATADSLAAAADLSRSKASGEPVSVIRGLESLLLGDDGAGASSIPRPRTDDLFR